MRPRKSSGSQIKKRKQGERMKENIQRDWPWGSDLRGWYLRCQESKCLGKLTQMDQRLAEFLNVLG